MNRSPCSFLVPAVICAITAALGCRQLQGPPRILFPGIVNDASAHAEEGAALFEELGGEPAFLDLARYLYRWYLDEKDYEHADPDYQDQLWIRRLQVVADAGDNSRYLEVVFPALELTVLLKRADYRISELKLNVQSGGYRVIRVSRDRGLPDDYAVLGVNTEALFEKLFERRLERQYACEALEAHVQTNLLRQCDVLAEDQRGRVKSFDFAPVNAIDNELWVFWEEGKWLFRVSSDIDLSNPDAWQSGKLSFSGIDVVSQTVVSFDERPGDRQFVTRDQVGRALYNCVVLGRKRAVMPASSAASPPGR